MKTIDGNILDDALLSTVDAVCITTNGMTKRNGQAVMGAGVALAAAQKWPVLPGNLGTKLQQLGNKVHILTGTVRKDGSILSVLSFPTKNDWKDKSDINLITKSCSELKEIADALIWKNVLLPPPGCGLGGLNWNNQVKPAIGAILDDRFTIVFKAR